MVRVARVRVVDRARAHVVRAKKRNHEFEEAKSRGLCHRLMRVLAGRFHGRE